MNAKSIALSLAEEKKKLTLILLCTGQKAQG
jgi:hypothetical protein